MGYTTEFRGKFKTDKPVDEDTYNLINGLATTRRMKRNPEELAKRIGKTTEDVIKLYGKECQLWVNDKENFGSNKTPDVVDYNNPPNDQPGLWCQWEMRDDHQTIVWDEGEKFYNYVEWIRYIITNILKPKGYILNGEIDWRGEDFYDQGTIIVENNEVKKQTR